MLASQFAARCGGIWNGDPQAEILEFATDSRDVKPGDLFIAIPGARVDGHDFVEKALELGAVASLAEKPVLGPSILVDQIEAALARFGRSVRDEFNGPVIGITGSAGKTTTKEFLAAALGVHGPVLKSAGNKNTEYTSPLLWANLKPDTGFVVVEMAMRGFGQIAHLASISKPTVGLITNIGYSHLLQVGDRDGIAKAKGELLQALPESGIAVLWREDDFLTDLVALASGRKILTFGFSAEADCQITSYEPISWSSSTISGTCLGENWTATLPALGKHVALDAAAAILTAKVCGVDPNLATSNLSDVILPPMRMEIREVNGATVLLDTYNASPPSMLSAIESVQEAPSEGRKLAILGQMLELGNAAESAHRRIGQAVREARFDEVLFIGENMKFAAQEAGNSARYSESEGELRSLVSTLQPGDVLLVKGSRALQLEKIFD